MPVGTATLDFGAFPGTTAITSVAVTGQTNIQSTSAVEAYVFPATTANHSADEHIVDPPANITVGNVIAGTGFTIYGSPSTGPCYGQWNIVWVWVT